MLAQAGQLGVRQHDVLAHVLRVRRGVAQPLDALDPIERAQQQREAHGLRTAGAQITPVGVDVLAEQRHLAHAVAGHGPHLGDQLGRRARYLAAAGRRHDAVRATAVAADADLQPTLKRPRAPRRQMAGEALELEVALGGQRVAGQKLGQAVHLPRPERHVDEREPSEHLLLDRLRPAAPDAHDPLGVLALQPLGLTEMRHEAAVGRLADRAGVEQDQIGLGALRRLRIAERLEHPPHPLGVVLVHLTAEGGDVIPLGHAAETVAGDVGGGRESAATRSWFHARTR